MLRVCKDINDQCQLSIKILILACEFYQTRTRSARNPNAGTCKGAGNAAMARKNLGAANGTGMRRR